MFGHKIALYAWCSVFELLGRSEKIVGDRESDQAGDRSDEERVELALEYLLDSFESCWFDPYLVVICIVGRHDCLFLASEPLDTRGCSAVYVSRSFSTSVDLG